MKKIKIRYRAERFDPSYPDHYIEISIRNSRSSGNTICICESAARYLGLDTRSEKWQHAEVHVKEIK